MKLLVPIVSTIFLLLFGFSLSLAQETHLSLIQKNLSGTSFQESSIWNLDILNAGEHAITLSLRAQIEGDAGILYLAQTHPFTVRPGLNPLDSHSFPGIASLQVNRLNKEGSPSGILNICVEALTQTKQKLANSCMDHLPIPTAPPRLVYPFDGEALETDIPTFSWLPPMPAEAGILYNLKILELDEEKASAASYFARPVFFQKDRVPVQQLTYPLTSQDFDRNKSYAWQVEAWAAGKLLGKTEVWTFHFEEKAKKKNLDFAGPFPELKPKIEGGYYLARDGRVPFYFESRYNEKELLGRLNLYQPGSPPIKLMPEQLQKQGQSTYVLYLDTHSQVESGAYYILEVLDTKNKCFKMRFKPWQS